MDPEAEARSKLRKVLSEVASFEDSLKILSKLDSVQKLKISLEDKDVTKLHWFWYAVILTVGLLCAGYNTSIFETRLSDYLFESKCLVNVPQSLENLLLPRFDCSICKNLTEIEKLENVQPDLFEAKYAYSSVPVVVKDATRAWTTNVFDFNFFKNLYLNHSDNVQEANCQFFPYRTNFKGLLDVFEMSDERATAVDSEPWYVGWSNCDPETANILRQHYQKPYFLPETSESTKTDWIFMGSPGYGAHMHVDKVGHPSWQAQIKGRKQWTLEPFPECYFSCNTLEITVEPGEISRNSVHTLCILNNLFPVVLDTDKWFHKTLILGEEISITIGTEYD